MLELPEYDAYTIISVLQKLYHHVSIDVDINEVLDLIYADKKNERAEVNFVLLENIGVPVINQRPDDRMIRKAVEFSLQQIKSVVLQS